MSQTRSAQLSSRERGIAILGVAGIVLLILFLYRPAGPQAKFEDLGELAPLPDSFSVYTKQDGDPLALYRAGQYERFVESMSSGGPDLGDGELLYLGSAQLMADHLADAVYSLRRLLGSDDGLIVAEARWQLAQAYLRSDEAEPALDELRHLARERGHRTFEATQKLAILESRLPKTLTPE